jgi:hypothetical protein
VSEDLFVYPDPEEVEFSREQYAKMYYSGEAAGINPLRWERARDDVRFDDVVFELTKHHSNSISCPFHGRDSRPSFYVYPPAKGNNGWCFGCPPRQQFYDSIRFISKLLGISRVKALIWLENKFALEPIAAVVVEEEEETTLSLTFEDLTKPYIDKAAKDIIANKDPELAQEYLRVFFEAERDKAVLPLASVLGRESLAKIVQRKGFK